MAALGLRAALSGLVLLFVACGDEPSAPAPPAPALTSVAPDRISTSGGTLLTLTGTGFTANQAGSNTVTIGGAACGSVAAASNTEITCASPAGVEGAAAVTVSNANGSATLTPGLTRVAPTLYAADGREGTLGNLYRVNITTGAATAVGPIGFAITGLAFGPDGTLYGVTSSGPGTTPGEMLVTIDVTTGAGTAVAALEDAGMVGQGCTDITFIGARLLCWGQPAYPLNQRLLEVDPATGLVTDLGGGIVTGGGNGLAADLAGTLLLIRVVSTTRTIFEVDPVSGVATVLRAVTPDGLAINSMAYLEGVLYAVQSEFRGGTVHDLATVDPATGALVVIGALPEWVDGIAGNFR